MPSGYGEIVPVKDHGYSLQGDWLATHYPNVERTYDSEQDFRQEWRDITGLLYNKPSVAVWVPFNESWGQFKTGEILQWTKQLDSTWVVDGPSGWVDRGSGDLRDYHLYGERLSETLPIEPNRGMVVGEFGGLGFPVPGHSYTQESWSYQGYQNSQDLETAYQQLIGRVVQLRQQGFSAG